MNIDAIFWWTGALLCIGGGVCALIVVLWLLFERAAKCFTNGVAIVRIMQYARRNGLDLYTGKPIEPDGENA